jgi:RNA polymerase sigma-70 factor (ECF subfamily)
MDITDNVYIAHTTEADLWRQFKEGDKRAFSKIYHLYYQDLYTYGLKVTADPEVTEDCIQDLFLVLWNSRERVSYVQSAKAYLFKSFRGRLFKQLKKTKKYSLFTRTFVSQENYIEFSAEELSYEEIGEILPLSYQSIRNCVYEAVKNLKKHLAFSLLLLAVIIKYGI